MHSSVQALLGMTRSFQSDSGEIWRQDKSSCWGQALSPVSLSIQQSELARAQKLSTGGMTPSPGFSRNKTSPGSLRTEPPGNHSAIAATEVAQDYQPKGDREADCRTGEILMKTCHVDEVPSSIKNPLYEQSVSEETSGAVNCTVDPIDGPTTQRHAHASVSFRSAIRRAADKTRQDAEMADSFQPLQAGVHLLQESGSSFQQPEANSHPYHESGALNSEQQPIRGMQKAVSSAGKTPFRSSWTGGECSSGFSNHMTASSVSHLRKSEGKPLVGTAWQTASGGHNIAGGGFRMPVGDIATPDTMVSIINPIWRPDASSEEVTETVLETLETPEDKIGKSSDRPVRCSLLESMNSVSEEIKQGWEHIHNLIISSCSSLLLDLKQPAFRALDLLRRKS